jgi:poly(glycerol-phosphate) alpha-glucosyltransferase
MKLALLTPHISRRGGGLKDAVLGLARALRDRPDVQLNVLSVADDFSAEDRALWDSIPLRVFNSPVLGGFRYSPELARSVRSLNPDLVHTHGLWTYLSLVTCRFARASASSRPYVVSPHGMLDPWALRNSGVKKQLAALAFERRHLTNAACLHAVSQGEAEAFRAYGLTNPICVISNGVDLVDLGVPAPASPWDTSRVGNRKVLLYLGRLHPKKGLPLLLRAWEKTPAAQEEWMLALAGWDQGGHVAELEKMVRDLNLSDSVEFPGPLFGATRGAAYRNADAFVLPSFSEGQPLTVLEAWAHALPVIMTRACNLPDGFAAGAAIQIEPTVESVAAGLEEFVQMDPEALQRMGKAGRDLVERNYTWPRIASQMDEVYRWVLGGGAQPEWVAKAK